MTLPKKQYEERFQTICKTYITINKKATAKQIAEFINTHNFGISVTSGKIQYYLSRNIHKDYKSGRGCLRDCYNYTQKGQQPRQYYIEE